MILCTVREDQRVSSPDLRVGQFYRVVSDPIQDDDGFVRIVDGSGEVRRYPGAFFEFLKAGRVASPAPVVPRYLREGPLQTS